MLPATCRDGIYTVSTRDRYPVGILNCQLENECYPYGPILHSQFSIFNADLSERVAYSEVEGHIVLPAESVGGCAPLLALGNA